MSPQAVLRIRNDYKWMLDPRYGRITAYVDRRRAGRIDLGGELTLGVDAEVPHEVRVRLWWYRSPVVLVRLEPGEDRLLRADIRKDLSVVKRMGLMARHPSTCLHLGEGPP